jgi:cellulose synthase/poly-beta-1,6-N-acetylglucosamine synthase-like glycosyltransferase
MKNNKYVLVTAAQNEEDFIETTIRSVISQTILPLKWVIVSDGSTDRTDEIVNEYFAKFDFIEFIRIDSSEMRNFRSKVNAIEAGYAKMNDIDYDYFGNLDADMALEPGYYETILKKFKMDSDLGIAGGKIFDQIDDKPVEDISSPDSVGGQIQLFRRQCFNDVGGFLPLKMGGEDTIAEVMARMHGWKVQTFPDIRALHHRQTGTAQTSIYRARWHLGIQEYLYGSHPLFEFAKCIHRFKEKPYVLGSVLRFWGYLWAFSRAKREHIPPEVIRYLHREQIHKLLAFFKLKNSVKQLD